MQTHTAEGNLHYFGWIDPLKSYLVLVHVFHSPSFPSPLTHLSITAIPSPLSGRHPVAAAAVTGGQEVKAKVECHTHGVALMPACCVSPWMESSQWQTRWRDPDALTFAWACPFPSRGQSSRTVLSSSSPPPPPDPPGHHHYCCNSCHENRWYNYHSI